MWKHNPKPTARAGVDEGLRSRGWMLHAVFSRTCRLAFKLGEHAVNQSTNSTRRTTQCAPARTTIPATQPHAQPIRSEPLKRWGQCNWHVRRFPGKKVTLFLQEVPNNCAAAASSDAQALVSCFGDLCVKICVTPVWKYIFRAFGNRWTHVNWKRKAWLDKEFKKYVGTYNEYNNMVVFKA